MADLKRIGDIVQTVRNDGPFAPLTVYGLADRLDFFGVDYVLANFAVVEGEKNQYVHMLVEPANDPAQAFVITTGAKAIMDKLAQVELSQLPVLVKFKKGHSAKGTWFDIE